jgi:hypothetical protein
MLVEVILASGLVAIAGALAFTCILRATASTRLHVEHVKPECTNPGCSAGEAIIRCVCGKHTSIVIR